MSQQTQRRGWTVNLSDFVSETGFVDDAAFRAEVRQSLLDAEAIGHRLGGAMVSRPVREEHGPGLFETVGWVFNWQSYVPAQRRVEDSPPVELEEQEPEPSAAGSDD